MDDTTYEQLRLQLEERSRRLTEAGETLLRFARAIQYRVNYDSGKKREVCIFGSMTNDQFVEREYDILPFGIGFTLKILFRDTAGDDIFSTLVHFKAQHKGDSVSVQCLNTQQIAVLTLAELETIEGQQKVTKMLDAPVSEAVRKALDS